MEEKLGSIRELNVYVSQCKQVQIIDKSINFLTPEKTSQLHNEYLGEGYRVQAQLLFAFLQISADAN